MCVCFVHFDLEMCFAPQRRALFRHLNFQKWSESGVFLTFWLGNVLRATTACNFSSLLSWLRTRRFSEPTFRLSGATNHWKNSESRLSYLFAHLHLLSSYSFSSTLLSSDLYLLSASALLCFSSVHIVGSLTSKLPSIIYNSAMCLFCTIFWSPPMLRNRVSRVHFPSMFVAPICICMWAPVYVGLQMTRNGCPHCNRITFPYILTALYCTYQGHEDSDLEKLNLIMRFWTTRMEKHDRNALNKIGNVIHHTHTHIYIYIYISVWIATKTCGNTSWKPHGLGANLGTTFFDWQHQAVPTLVYVGSGSQLSWITG